LAGPALHPNLAPCGRSARLPSSPAGPSRGDGLPGRALDNMCSDVTLSQSKVFEV
jgi:hypothetical protein